MVFYALALTAALVPGGVGFVDLAAELGAGAEDGGAPEGGGRSAYARVAEDGAVLTSTRADPAADAGFGARSSPDRVEPLRVAAAPGRLGDALPAAGAAAVVDAVGGGLAGAVASQDAAGAADAGDEQAGARGLAAGAERWAAASLGLDAGVAAAAGRWGRAPGASLAEEPSGTSGASGTSGTSGTSGGGASGGGARSPVGNVVIWHAAILATAVPLLLMLFLRAAMYFLVGEPATCVQRILLSGAKHVLDALIVFSMWFVAVEKLPQREEFWWRDVTCSGLLDARLVAVLLVLSVKLGEMDAYLYAKAEEYETHTRGTFKAKILDSVSHRNDEIIPTKNTMGAMFLYEWVWRLFYCLTHGVFCLTVILKVLGFNMEGYSMLITYFAGTLLSALLSVSLWGPDAYGVVLIFAEELYEVGDLISIGSVEGGEHDSVTGFIEHIGLRSTGVRCFDMRYTTVPNRNVTTHQVRNWFSRPRKCIFLEFHVSSQSNMPQVREFETRLNQLITTHPQVDQTLYTKASLRAVSMDLEFRVVCYNVCTAKKRQVQSDIIIRINELAKALGITITTPRATYVYPSKEHVLTEPGPQHKDPPLPMLPTDPLVTHARTFAPDNHLGVELGFVALEPALAAKVEGRALAVQVVVGHEARVTPPSVVASGGCVLDCTVAVPWHAFQQDVRLEIVEKRGCTEGLTTKVLCLTTAPLLEFKELSDCVLRTKKQEVAGVLRARLILPRKYPKQWLNPAAPAKTGSEEQFAAARKTASEAAATGQWGAKVA